MIQLRSRIRSLLEGLAPNNLPEGASSLFSVLHCINKDEPERVVFSLDLPVRSKTAAMVSTFLISQCIVPVIMQPILSAVPLRDCVELNLQLIVSALIRIHETFLQDLAGQQLPPAMTWKKRLVLPEETTAFWFSHRSMVEFFQKQASYLGEMVELFLSRFYI